MPDEWLSVHAFYAANANPMLVDCVTPLVASLRERDLLARWFFVRYWLEGPHVRLRLLPRDPDRAGEVRDAAAEALAAFLRRRPALYEEDRDGSVELYKNLYLAEYGEASWNDRYGPDGAMPFRDNNTVHWLRYEREYDRYGGPAGIALAEWHFEQSSDLVLALLATTNVHVRTVLLGQAAQLTAGLCFSFLGSERAVAEFLRRYRQMWETSYQESSDDQHAQFDRSYARMADRLRERLTHLRDCAWERPEARPTALERRWVAHGRELRDRVVALAGQGALTFRDGVVADPDTALAILLSSYVHMTNNRLGANILDEIYLSYVLARALDDLPVLEAAG